MIYSIYHFFVHLLTNKDRLLDQTSLQNLFTSEHSFISCSRTNLFPDLVLRRNVGNDVLTGGEFVELKDGLSYTVTSFNSTIPTGEKKVAEWIEPTSACYKRMRKIDDDDPYHLPVRQVYYLVRGRRKDGTHPRVCLVHGSFFATISPQELIKRAFAEILKEGIRRSTQALDLNTIEILLETISFEQYDFSQVRRVEGASVNPRFRIMTEINSGGNILQYPLIQDNTLNFVLPLIANQPEVPAFHLAQLKQAFKLTDNSFHDLHNFSITHQYNGPFLVFQAAL